ncbi:hypothetical protein [Pseudoponticoccus marisrubri]|uniref:hypothetical protein n=1 Tax=Pseudoponticoccus marisrubri TaxID=1685382 RepID=UPI0012FD0EFE|nr:hypothetical protein [Pseudoponticoccus marisrubri]
MDWRGRKKPLMGLVGGIGLAVAIGGLVGQWYAPGTAIAGALIVWIVGAMIVHVICD